MWSGSIGIRSAASTTGISVSRLSRETSRLWWLGSRCWTITKAVPLSAFRSGSRASSAPMPPADAPMPTTGMDRLGRGSCSPSWSVRSSSVRLSVVVMRQRAPAAAVSYHVPLPLAIAQQAFHELHVALVVDRPALKLSGKHVSPVGPLLFGHAPGQGGAFLMGAQQRAEELVDFIGLRGQIGVRRKSMADVAAVAQHLAVLDLPQRAMTFGAGEPGRLAEHVVDSHICQLLGGDRRLQPDIERNLGRRARLLASQRAEQRRQAGRQRDMIDIDKAQRVKRHGENRGI